MMKKYHQQNLVEHEADSAVRECRTQSLSKLVGVHDQDRRMVWLWAAWATQLLAKATLAYAQLTRSLRGPYADVRAQLRKNQPGYVKLEYIIPVTLLKTSFKKPFKVSLRHPYDSNVGKKCLRRLTPTSVLLTPQVLTRIPILNTNTEV